MTSRYGMPLHKFIHKYERPPPPPVRWRPHEGLAYPPNQLNGRWEIFTQQPLSIQPRSAIALSLGFGAIIVRGVCLVSLRQTIKEMRCSLQDGFIAESVENIIITIQNNSDVIVNIAAGDSLCIVTHRS